MMNNIVIISMNIQKKEKDREHIVLKSKKSQYERGHIIGEGAFSQCYISKVMKGENVGKIIIIKEIKYFVPRGKEMYKQQVKVLRSVSTIKRDFIIRPIDNWIDEEAKGSYYIALENGVNGTLNDFAKHSSLQKQKYLKEDQVLYIANEILKAVRVLVQHKIVHRDIKTDNMIIDQDFNIKMIDFGLAIRGQQSQPTGKSLSGTPQYMAPEIVKNWKNPNSSPYSYPIDVWAVGIMLFFIVYRKYPFTDQTKQKIYEIIPSSDIVYQNSGHYTQNIIKLIKKMLNKDPQKRPTAEQLLAEPIFNDISIKKEQIKAQIKTRYAEYFYSKNNTANVQWLYPTTESKFDSDSKFQKQNNKVKIQKVFHSQGVGIFFFFSNRQVIGYFNDEMMLKLDWNKKQIVWYKLNSQNFQNDSLGKKSLLFQKWSKDKKQIKQNKVLIQKRFQLMKKISEDQFKLSEPTQKSQTKLSEPTQKSQTESQTESKTQQMYISLLAFTEIDQGIMVRLNNHTVQTFMVLNKGKYKYEVRLNNNLKNPQQITVVINDKEIKYNSYYQCDGVSLQLVKFVRNLIGFMFDTSKMQLKSIGWMRIQNQNTLNLQIL